MSSPNLTARDLSGFLGQGVSGAGGLVVRFFYARVRLGGTTGASAGKFATRLFVGIQPKGDRLTEAVEMIQPEEAQQRFPQEYHAFKSYEDTPTNGTPLNDLPGMTQAMIGQLVLSGIRSIEDLVNLPSDAASQIGLDAVTARNIALTWFKRKDQAGDTLQLSEQLARSTEAMREMMEQMASMRANNEAQERTIQALQASLGGGAMQAPMQGQPHSITGNTPIAVNDDEFAPRPMADIFGSGGVVTGAADMRDPLAD